MSASMPPLGAPFVEPGRTIAAPWRRLLQSLIDNAGVFTVLQPGVTLGSSATTVVKAAGPVQIGAATVANPTDAAVTLAVSVTRSGASGAIVVVPGMSVPAGGTVQIAALPGLVLASGDAVSASGAGLVMIVSGLVQS